MKIKMNYPCTFQLSDYDCVVVVDIGFAQKLERNCGLVIAKKHSSKKKFQFEAFQDDFTETIVKIFNLLKIYGTRKNGFALIIEAPLSVYFENGSPKKRSFARTKSKCDEESNCWYVPIGASVMAGAVILLKSLLMKAEDLKATSKTISLFEAFSINKSGITKKTAKAFIVRSKIGNNPLLPVMRKKVINGWVDAAYIMDAIIKNGKKMWRVEKPNRNSENVLQNICAFFRLDGKGSSKNIPAVLYLDHRSVPSYE